MPGSTYDPIQLISAKLEGIADLPAYADALIGCVKTVKEKRDDFYKEQTKRRDTVLFVRAWMIRLAIAALLATAVAAGLKLSGVAESKKFLGMDPDSAPLFLALASYAVMSALSFWETASSGTASYFRHVELRLANRDLWTSFEFEVVGLLEDHNRGVVPAGEIRDRLRAAAQGVITRMDALARSELADWKGEFQASISQLGTVSRDGFTAAKAELQGIVDARVAKAEQLAIEAKATAEAAKPKPPSYAMVVVSGAFSGELEVFLDDRVPTKTANGRFPLSALPPGIHSLRIAAKDQAGKPLEAAQYVDLKSGISEVKMVLS